MIDEDEMTDRGIFRQNMARAGLAADRDHASAYTPRHGSQGFEDLLTICFCRIVY